ncbi:MAG: Holliday junction branch migration protein RuvA [Patescibacteria group bacterium]
MISYLKGTILQIEADTLTVLAGNIGYQIFMTAADLGKLKKNQQAELLCHHHITDRSQELYGFLNLDQKRLFKLLIDNVSGVGPKSALKILDKINFDDIKATLDQGSTDKLEARGLTRKLAEKIIVGLKGKIGNGKEPLNFQAASLQSQEALQALTNLGYKKFEAQAVLNQIDVSGKNTEEIIRAALRRL